MSFHHQPAIAGWATGTILSARHILWAAFCFGTACCFSPSVVAETVVTTKQQANGIDFRFDGIRSPSRNDLAATAKTVIADGKVSPFSGGLQRLIDDRLPSDEDQPDANFFFASGSNGGRLVFDLGRTAALDEINSYSWHPNSRGPQFFDLYVSDGSQANFNAAPPRSIRAEDCGWRKIASVDTRTKDVDSGGGQHAVTIRATEDELSLVRYLLFDIRATETINPHGDTFFSEIDVIETGSSATASIEIPNDRFEVRSDDQRFTFIYDVSNARDLESWTREKLAPIVNEWYPKIIDLLPSDGYRPHAVVYFRYRDDMGGTPASAGGNRVNLSTPWFRRQLDGEAAGAVVHELVHVVQSYSRASRRGGQTSPTPSWVVEGIADYVRWFLYEPQSGGARIRPQQADRVSPRDSYRVTANFLNWVVANHDPELVRLLNVAAREGQYREEFWTTRTKMSLEELSAAWKKDLAK